MAIYYKEIEYTEKIPLLRDSRYTSERLGCFTWLKNKVHFWGLYKTWERSYDLKFYQSSKGYYIRFHSKRLYFDIIERNTKRLVKVNIEGGREV